ncbi:hypothetical protein BKA61DRAFT_676419 [Leptodontidium sp. MPI-SDFR-AT-0119]|nr:hypothetical protein BKA61DRAFT_676419 [Leptodontidium sp. MPI-SDFR-AT-0119]
MSLVAMLDNDVAEALFLMSHLPDFNEELFVQLGDPLDTFTCFPKLPIELRLKVWRWSFPRGREVSIAHELFSENPFSVFIGDPSLVDYYSTERELNDKNASSSLPPTLFVNQESRQETLRHYVVVFCDVIERDLDTISFSGSPRHTHWNGIERDVRVVAIAPGHFKRGEPRTRISSTFSLNVYIFTPF